jgi:predicted  nucleic acid-binding Zn-ribbon protein
VQNDFREFRESMTETIQRHDKDIKHFRTNQEELYDRLNRMVQEFKDLRSNEETKLREIARDFDTKYLYKKDKAPPLLEEKVNRLQELAMATRD